MIKENSRNKTSLTRNILFSSVNNRLAAKNCKFSNIEMKRSEIAPIKYLKFVNCDFKDCDAFFSHLSAILSLKPDNQSYPISIFGPDEVIFESCSGVPSKITKLLEEREQS